MLLPLDTSYSKHALIGFLIGLWLVFFLVVIAPFDASDLSFKIRLILMPPYGLMTLSVYAGLIPIQNWAYKKWNQWNIQFEVGFIFLFHSITLGLCFAYYKSPIMNGEYSFEKFVFEVYYPIFFILLFIIIFLRWYLFKPNFAVEVELKTTLNGDNKLDILNVYWGDLVHVSSADNYVEVSYLEDQVLHKKLLRTTLKNILQQEPRLVRIHRSHLINPAHFVEWKDSNVIKLAQMEVPVSKNYRETILNLKTHP